MDFSKAKRRLLADSYVIYRRIKNESDGQNLQRHISRVEKWIRDNRININIEKCKRVTFSTRISENEHVCVVNGQAVRKVSSWTYVSMSKLG